MTIKEVLEITNQIENIDGDDVYILNRGMCKGLDKLRQRIDKEKEDCMFSMLNKDVEFMSNNFGFALAFRPVKWKDSKKWIPCLIYRYKDE